MTKHIYLRGNIGALDMRIYDADTDMMLLDVAKITIVTTASVVQAELVRHSSPNATVDVVAGPIAANTGQTFYRVTLDADTRRTHCDTVHIAKVQSVTMNEDGTLDFIGAKLVSMHDVVSDAEVKQARDPKNVLEESAIRALLATLHKALIEPLLRAVPRPQTGGAVSVAASHPPMNTGRVPAFFSPALKKAASCPECFDTGVTNGWFHPCSKGCTP